MNGTEYKSEEDTENKSVLEEELPEKGNDGLEDKEQKSNEEKSKSPSEDNTKNEDVLEDESPDNNNKHSEDKEKKFREEKRKKDEERKEKLRKEKEAEQLRRGIKKKEVEFKYFVDFCSIGVIGIVFFVTCLTGLLNGVSSKELSIRAVVSVLFASVVVYIFKGIVKKNFCKEENDKEDGGADQ